MKAIFLDHDGVMNSRTFYCKRPKKCNDETEEKRVAYLRDIVAATKAKIVLCGGLRGMASSNNSFYKEFEEKMAKYNMEVYSHTEILKNRGVEIRAWLKDHEEITEFVILDDEYTDTIYRGLGEYIVKVKYNEGLSMEDVKKAKRLFKLWDAGEIKYPYELVF